MLNPGFHSKVGKAVKNVESGPMLLCPECKKPLMEAVAEKVKTRCKHCGNWVYLYKKSD